MTAETLKRALEEKIAMCERIGHPCLMERFVLRNGKAFEPAKRIGRKRKAKMCFRNAHLFVAERGDDTAYVEGFTMIKSIELPIHHAWATMTGTDAMDPTLDAENHEYFGIAFKREAVNRLVLKSGYYGLFTNGLTLNAELMFELDPELEEIATAVMKNRPKMEA